MFKSKAWNIAIIAYFTTRINLFLLAFYFTYALTRKPVKGHWLYHDGEVHSNWFVNAFQRWDSYWFLNIVREGYQWHGIINQVTNHPGPDVEETNITPFPLYPLLIKIVTYFVQDPSIAGLIISQICFIISLGLFYKLVRLDFNHETSVLAVW